jgi:hypothetical protein
MLDLGNKVQAALKFYSCLFLLQNSKKTGACLSKAPYGIELKVFAPYKY